MPEVTTVEIKTTKTQKPYKVATLSDGKSVKVWGNHLRYGEIVEGAAIGDTELDYDTKYKSYSLKDTSYVANKNYAKPTISESVQKAQFHKDIGIKTSSTAGKATDLLVALIGSKTFDPKDWQNKWKEIRQYLWENYDYVEDNTIPF